MNIILKVGFFGGNAFYFYNPFVMNQKYLQSISNDETKHKLLKRYDSILNQKKKTSSIINRYFPKKFGPFLIRFYPDVTIHFFDKL